MTNAVPAYFGGILGDRGTTDSVGRVEMSRKKDTWTVNSAFGHWINPESMYTESDKELLHKFLIKQ